jgi:hypothetical protein
LHHAGGLFWRVRIAHRLYPGGQVGRHANVEVAARRVARGLRDRQREYIDRALRTALSPGIEPDAVVTKDAAILLAAKLKTPLQIGRHFVRAFEARFEASVKPIDAATVEGALSPQIDELEPQLTRHGTNSLVDQFDAKPAEIRQLLRGGLDPARARELTDDMRAAGLPL